MSVTIMPSMSGATPANGRIDVFNVTVIRAIIRRSCTCLVATTVVASNPPGAPTTM